MRRGFKCKKELLEALERKYEEIVVTDYHGNFLEALKNFDNIAEIKLRTLLRRYYSNERSRDQAWKTCKGSLYEYAIFKYITNIVENNNLLKEEISIIMGDEGLSSYRDQIAIRNWCDIFPDVDILIIKKDVGLVKAILSCKTSLRERLTETAFWKREIEKQKVGGGIKLVFITTDKDNELKTETNRYILLHVVDYTFITDAQKYTELMNAYHKKYGERSDFDKLLQKVRFIDEMEAFLEEIVE